jgi:hypothetical protein
MPSRPAPAGQGPLQGRDTSPRHGRTASKTLRGTGRGAGRGGGVAREPLFGLPGLRLHLLVGRAVAFVGGLVPASARWSRSSAARSRASARPGRRQGPPRAGPARPGPRATPPRSPGPRLSRPHPGVVHGKADDPLTPGLLDNPWARSATLRQVVWFPRACGSRRSVEASTAMAAVAHPCSREEQP